MASGKRGVGKILLGLAAVAVAVAAAVVIVLGYEHLERQHEPGEEVPLMAQADLPGSLTMTRSICEGQAKIARKAAREKLIPKKESALGAKRYTDLKEALDDCITSLLAALTHQPSKEEAQRLEAKFAKACAKRAAFMDWCARMELPKYFDSDPLTEARKGLPDWLNQRRTGNEPFRTLVSSSLKGARLSSWEELDE